MKKIYQTIIGGGKGNCMQAAIASLLDLELEEVPIFMDFEYPTNEMIKFMSENGYELSDILHNKKHNLLINDLCFEENRFNEDGLITKENLENKVGINQLFYAAVKSPKYFNRNDGFFKHHAVIIDKNFNIVHDPNPEYYNLHHYPLSEVIDYNGILEIWIFNKKSI